MSPAYDMTYSNSIGGEHATTVDGNSRDPSRRELLAFAKRIGYNSAKAKQIVGEIQEIVFRRLGRYIIHKVTPLE